MRPYSSSLKPELETHKFDVEFIIEFAWGCRALTFLGGWGGWGGGWGVNFKRVTVTAWWWSSSLQSCAVVRMPLPERHLTLATKSEAMTKDNKTVVVCAFASKLLEKTYEKDGPLTMFKLEKHACCHGDDRWNTSFYTAPMPFGSRFAANVDPGEFESTMQILRGGKRENHYFHSSDTALWNKIHVTAAHRLMLTRHSCLENIVSQLFQQSSF